MSIHPDPHPLAGATVLIASHPDAVEPADVLAGPVEYRIEDYWDRITGGSWMTAQGNPAALKYAIRGAMQGLPTDNEVVYGKVGPFGHLIHVSELGEVVS